LRQKGIQDIYVISANDPFVMNAWKKSFGVDPAVRSFKEGSIDA
jgi:peroxiredoxin